jgi:hypothetical protein
MEAALFLFLFSLPTTGTTGACMEAIDPQKARAKTGADLCSASTAWSIARNGSTASCTAGAALETEGKKSHKDKRGTGTLIKQ